MFACFGHGRKCVCLVIFNCKSYVVLFPNLVCNAFRILILPLSDQFGIVMHPLCRTSFMTERLSPRRLALSHLPACILQLRIISTCYMHGFGIVAKLCVLWWIMSSSSLCYLSPAAAVRIGGSMYLYVFLVHDPSVLG